MNGSFVPDYLVLVFFASCGVFQMAAACIGLPGLQFFQGRRRAFPFGLGFMGFVRVYSSQIRLDFHPAISLSSLFQVKVPQAGKRG